MSADSGMVEDIIKDAYRLAVSQNIGVEFECHDVKIQVTPLTKPADVYKKYLHEVNSK